jgi:preprotein translocase subunit SecA
MADQSKILTTLDEIISGGWSEIKDPEATELISKLSDIIADKKVKFGEAAFTQVIRQIILQSIDMFWVDHLELMDYLRGSVNLRAYGQHDPLVEYKKEGLRLFKQMLSAISAQIIKLIPHIGGQMASQEEVVLEETEQAVKSITSRDGSGRSTSSQTSSKEPQVGRNEPCPCGSGKKYKNCGLKNTDEHKSRVTRK